MEVGEINLQHFSALEILTSELHKKLESFSLFDAFSLNKKELVCVFSKADKYFSIKLVVDFGRFFFFFYDYPLPRGSSVFPLFQSLKAKAVLEVKAVPNDRVFAIIFEDEILVFKMYGPLTNVILIKGNEQEMFRTQIKNDLMLYKSDLINRLTSLLESQFQSRVYFVHLCDGNLIVKSNENPSDSLFKSNNIIDVYSFFSKYYISNIVFEKKKSVLISTLTKELKNQTNLLTNNFRSLEILENIVNDEQKGHLILSNIQDIPHGKTSALLLDYFNNCEIKIELNKDLNPQQNAEAYFKKAVKRKLQIRNINSQIEENKAKVSLLNEQIAHIELCANLKELNKYEKAHSADVTGQKAGTLFREFEKLGFKILVGKSAVNNDLLIKNSHKGDLWFHAANVSGSHVIVKQKSGFQFLPEVILYAAQLAAYYSKAKGSSMVSVYYTQRKYVRKPKGAEPGKVVIERQKSVMVEPLNLRG